VNRLIILVGLALLLLSGVSQAEALNAEKEAMLSEIISGWMGEQSLSASSASVTELLGYEPVKCGTPAILAIQSMVQEASLSVQEQYQAFTKMRFDYLASHTYGSPGGHFLIHFATSGAHKAYQVSIDNDGNGVPDFIESVGLILDSVWAKEIGDFGYEIPPPDGFYPSGIDDRYDIYLFDLATGIDMGGIYGATYQDTVFIEDGRPKATAFLVLDNDYSTIAIYEDKPLEAIRVTAAHEFFHAIQFGYDPYEFEPMKSTDPYDDRTHWMEMSAVWMEEQVYDRINDYYYYLPWFFAYNNISLRTAHLTLRPGVSYQYAAAVWPLYLSQTFGDDIVRQIWEGCSDSVGHDAFRWVFDEVIRDVSDDTWNFRTALSEFYSWAYFTGTRAVDGFGFEEAANYPMIPETWEEEANIRNFTNFPVEDSMMQAEFNRLPQYLGANYLRFIPSRLDEMRFTLDGEQSRIENRYDTVEFDWTVRMAKVNLEIGDKSVDLLPTVYGNGDEISIDDANVYSEIIAIIVPYAETKYEQIHFDARYGFSVPDTSEPFSPGTIFADPWPNPVKLSEAQSVKFRVITDRQATEEVRLDVFTLAGEKVYGIAEERSLIPEQDLFLDWNGRNEAGNIVASGLYLVYIRVGDDSEIFKVAVIE